MNTPTIRLQLLTTKKFNTQQVNNIIKKARCNEIKYHKYTILEMNSLRFLKRQYRVTNGNILNLQNFNKPMSSSYYVVALSTAHQNLNNNITLNISNLYLYAIYFDLEDYISFLEIRKFIIIYTIICLYLFILLQVVAY